MNTRVILVRWLPTLLAFPIGGQLVVWLLGGVDSLIDAGIAGVIVGITIGLLQYVALQPISITAYWIWASMIGMVIGSIIAYQLFGTDSTITALIPKGLICGAAVGIAQISSQKQSTYQVLLWGVTTSIAWAMGWFITANVIVDVQFHYAIFGASGAFVATIILAIFINACLVTNTTATGVTHA